MRRVLTALVLTIGLANLTACSRSELTLSSPATGSTTTPSTTAVTPPTTTPSTSTVPTPVTAISWSPCGRGECAVVAAPLDHDEPTGATIEIAVFRRPATGDRIGALFFNFGGPGAGAADILTSFPVPDEVAARFDLVGMDPRGVGGSTPLACGLDPAALYGVDPTIEDAADAATLIEVSQRYVDDCTTRSATLLPHVGTRDVARDMDLVRAAMGDETLNYVGYSYGTAIGQAYAELFPDRVRTMILDGVVDPDLPGVAGAVEQAEGFETALARWAAGCPQRPSCTSDDPIAAVDAMLAAAEAGIPAGGPTLGPGQAAVGLALPLYNVLLWPSLDRAVAEALAGDGSGMLDLSAQYLGIVDFATYFAVNCLDSTWPATTDQLLAEAKAAAATAPRFGEAIVTDYIRCVLWPVPAEPLGAITAPGAAPILVVSSTGDPATPYENGVRVADRLESGVLLTYDGDGHTITFQGSGCVDRVATDYLVDLVVPAEGAVC